MNRSPRIAILNAEDRRGGAARAAYRLHRGLCATGLDSTMLVQRKQRVDTTVDGPAGNTVNNLRAALDRMPTLLYPRRDRSGIFHPGWLPDGVAGRVRDLNPDIVHLHWITRGFINVGSLRVFGRPLVWTLHDMWAFTGGCHYDNDCGRYQQGCGNCPALGSVDGSDLSRRGWKRKELAYRDLPLTIVSPSHWLGSLASSSELLSRFPAHVIPNGIDTGVFHPGLRDRGRSRLGFGPGAKVILFGAANAAADPRKGMHFLEQALRMLAERVKGLSAVIFGARPPFAPPNLGMPVTYPGVISDDGKLSELYAAADIFVAPSMQENLSNTVMEALACGTPCVAFDVGGMADMIDHLQNGYLAKPADVEDLAMGIGWALEDEPRRLAMSGRAREKCMMQFDAVHVARRHRVLYESILADHHAGTKQ